MKTSHYIFLPLIALLLFTFTPRAISANQHYELTVQQVMGSLQKSSHPSQKGFLLIDVRTPEEHVSGFIPGTDMNIDFREIQQRHRELRANLEDHIVVYCQSGHRSNSAAETLTTLGYKHVYNVVGSMNAWESAEFPLEYPKR